VWRVSVSFGLFDRDSDGYIDTEELCQMLNACIKAQTSLSMSEDDVRDLVNVTVREVDANGDGKISFEEYREMISTDPSRMDYLTIEIKADQR